MESIILKANKLHKKVRNFILCSIDEKGFPTAKAVLPAKKRDKINKIYFVTNTDSNYVRQIMNNDKASVYFYNSFLYKGCLLKGTMKVIEDKAIKKMLWKKSYKKAYNNSDLTFSNPDFCILEFSTIKGRYYSMFKTTDFRIEEF